MKRGLTNAERNTLKARFAGIVARLGDEDRAKMGLELQETIRQMEELGAQGNADEGIAKAMEFAKKWELLAGL